MRSERGGRAEAPTEEGTGALTIGAVKIVPVPSTMKILVTGASGFIGLKLAERLLKDGHSVRAFGRSPTLHPSLAHLGVEYIQGDITNKEHVAQAVRNCEVIFHLAGFVSYRKKDRRQQYDVNVLGTRYIMEAALKANIHRVIHTSSVAAMGIPPPGTIGDERIEYNLEGKGLNYCDTKHLAELEVQRFSKEGLPVLMVNPGITFGEGDTHPHHHAIFQAMSKGSMIGVPTGGVTFSDIIDVVHAHVSAIVKGRIGERYALVSANLSFEEAALIFSRIFGSRPPLFRIPGACLVALGSIAETVLPWFNIEPMLTSQAAWLSQHKIFFSSKKAYEELDFRPTPFENMVKRTAPYYLGRSGKL